MSFARYSERVDSGVAWLDEVPAHWELTRLKRTCEIFPSNIDKKSYDNEPAILLCNYTDVYYNEMILEGMDFMPATATPDQIDKFRLRAGDTIITKDSETADDIAIAAYVPHDLPGVVCGYHLSMVRPKAGTYGAFVKRLFDSAYLKSRFAVLANGLTRVGLGQYALENVEIAMPPIDEQQAIVTFLDHETTKIDALVAEQGELITLLKEKRQAVISHAVTKGLDPNVPMKDSGVKWLGKVPVHWAITQLKRAIVLQRGHDLPADDREEGNVPIVSSGGITGRHDRAQAKAPGIVTGRYGTIGNFTFVDEDYWPLNTTLYSAEMFKNAPRFLWYMLQNISELFVMNSMKSAVPGVDRNDLHPEYVGLPPVTEQLRIADFLDRETAAIDRLVEVTGEAIALLQERRSALISAAVTGKIDVRALVSMESA